MSIFNNCITRSHSRIVAIIALALKDLISQTAQFSSNMTSVIADCMYNEQDLFLLVAEPSALGNQIKFAKQATQDQK